MNFTVLNNVTLKNQLGRNFAADWSEDGNIFILSDASVTILNFIPNMTNIENVFTFAKSELKVDQTYFAACNTKIRYEFLIQKLTKQNYFHALLDHNIVPKCRLIPSTVAAPVDAIWSPYHGRVKKQLIAVLSNTGNVEIFYQSKKSWKLLVNMTKLWVQKYMIPNWEKNSELPRKCLQLFKLHEDRVHESIAFSICWSSFDEINNCYYIIIGLKNGTMAIWKLKFPYLDETEVPLECIAIFVTGFKRINYIHWHLVNENLAYIIYCELTGLVKCMKVTICQGEIKLNFDQVTDIWADKDIAVSKIVSKNLQQIFYLFIIKGPNILFTILNHENNIEYCELYEVGHINITGIQQMKPNYFIITTFPGAMKSVELVVIDEQLKCTFQDVVIDFSWKFHQCHGLIRSPNGIIWGVLTYPCKIIDHLIVRTPIQLNFCTTSDIVPALYLNENSDSKMINSWECLEIIRCLSAKQNNLPCYLLKIPDNYDNLTMYELRITYFISIMCDTFIKFKPRCRKLTNTLPQPELVWKIIIYKCRAERLKKLLDLYDETPNLTQFQLNSIYLLNDAIQRFQNEDIFGEYFKIKVESSSLEGRVKIEVPKCRWCKNDLSSQRCIPPHPDIRCCISGNQLSGISKWECLYCELPAAEEIEEQEAICPLCGIEMISNY